MKIFCSLRSLLWEKLLLLVLQIEEPTVSISRSTFYISNTDNIITVHNKIYQERILFQKKRGGSTSEFFPFHFPILFFLMHGFTYNAWHDIFDFLKINIKIMSLIKTVDSGWNIQIYVKLEVTQSVYSTPA